VSHVESYWEKLKAEQRVSKWHATELHFNETLSPQLFFAMAPNLSELEFVTQAARVFLGRSFTPSELEYFRGELASLRLSRNEFLSMLRFNAEGKAHSPFTNASLHFWRCYRFALKATHRIPKLGPKLCRILELPRLLLVLSRLPRRLEELESEIEGLKRTQKSLREQK
jgi:hypothetical protein